ncbi:hypothetical protein [Nostoc sp. 'Peltigera membranacea cyanobiont' 232]|uniref:hypothetical protein n=1 Tax=Nostoc sp. 'Peltigera membranacea cyanobiont' 232 TaxID=2014531 RepID=UPI000B95804A|nr:hypothetical protein [Nostoc sp. 'Peltigera membranacea cyanobiont' 232]OYE02943.1 hypothetical protein CDG79_20975 [Nostoc sp. 'Peltigera membranacea cyanobiont' 232]
MDLSSGWTSVGNGDFTSSSGYIPACPGVPSLLNAQVVAIKISTENAKPTWYTGAWLDQKVLTGLDGSTPWITFSKKIGLGGNIIVFPQVISNYSIDISFPTYFKTVSVGVWIQ